MQYTTRGLKTSDILNISQKQFDRLTQDELRILTQRLAMEGNKRLKQFEKAGETSPAERYINRNSGGKFTTKGKNLNQLRYEFMRAKGFLQSQTGSLNKWREVKADTIQTLENKHDITINNDDFETFWKAYESLKELKPSVSNEGSKYKTLAQVEEKVIAKKDLDPHEIALEIYNEMKYAEQENNEDERGVSQFFPIS